MKIVGSEVALMRDGRFYVPYEKSAGVWATPRKGLVCDAATTQTNDMKLVPSLVPPLSLHVLSLNRAHPLKREKRRFCSEIIERPEIACAFFLSSNLP